MQLRKSKVTEHLSLNLDGEKEGKENTRMRILGRYGNRMRILGR